MRFSIPARAAALILICAMAPSGVAGLPDGLESVFREISGLYGGRWGFAVTEFDSGAESTHNGSRSFRMEIPHLPLTALAIELSNTGVIPLDSEIGLEEFFWERLHWAQQGGRGMCMSVIWSFGEGRIREWIASKGYSGTEIYGVFQDYPNCPVYDPNLISPSDALSFLRTVYENIDQENVRRICENPPFSEHIRQTLGFGNTVYGWIDVSESSKHIYMIVQRDGDTDLGVVVMAEGIENRANVDKGFRKLYEALTD